MNEEQMLELLQNMSEEELTALEATQFPEAIVKQAQAESASQDLAQALYGYGMFRADLEMAEEESEGTLSKEASAEFSEAAAEIEQALDAAMEATGFDQIEDTVEFHKQAHAAAGIIFAGYNDQLQKIAAGGKAEKVKALIGKASAKAKEIAGKAKYHAAGAAKHVKANKAAYLGGAAAAGAGYAAGKMQKKASEVSADEMAELVLSKIATEQVFVDNLEKSAAVGAKAAEKMKALIGKGKAHVQANKGKYLAGMGGAAAGGAAGYAAGKKKD